MRELKDKNKPMSKGMLKFCEYYLETRNAVQSYAKAYGYDLSDPKVKEKHYNSLTASSSGLLKDPRIKEYLEHRMLEMNYERDLSDKEIVMLLNKIALGGHYKENTRLEALKMLSRMKGLYDEPEKEQSININLSADLQEAINHKRKPNPEPDIED